MKKTKDIEPLIQDLRRLFRGFIAVVFLILLVALGAISYEFSEADLRPTIGTSTNSFSATNEIWPRPSDPREIENPQKSLNAIVVVAGALAGLLMAAVYYLGMGHFIDRVRRERDEVLDHLELQMGDLERLTNRQASQIETLSESEQRFRAIAERSSHGIIIHRDGCPLFANPAMAELLGYDGPEDLLGLGSIADFVFEDDVVRVRNLWTRRMDGEEMPDVVGYRCQRKDGAVISVEVRASTIDWGGETAVLAAAYDTTEQKSGEYAIRENAARLRRLLETIPYGVQEFNVEGTITFSNPAHAAMLGCEEDELIGRKIWDLEATDEKRAALKRYFAVMVQRQPTPKPYLSEVVTNHGTKIHIRIDWTYIRSKTGHLLGFSSIITDITESEETRRSLERSEEQFRTLAEASVQGITVIQDDKFVFVNPAAAQLVGYPSREALMAVPTVDHIVHPRCRDAIRRSRHARLNGRDVPQNYEVELISADGRSVRIENRVKIIEWDGRPAVFSIHSQIDDAVVADRVLETAE